MSGCLKFVGFIAGICAIFGGHWAIGLLLVVISCL